MARKKFSCTAGPGTTDLNHISNYDANGVGAIRSEINLTLHIIHEMEKWDKWLWLMFLLMI